MGLEELRRLKDEAKQPKAAKKYYIPKVSKKRQKQIELDKVLLEQDKDFYKMIWDASPHICQCGCNARLGKEPLTTMFHHLLPKAKYPMYRHTPENIMVLHPDCHVSWETSPTNPEIRKRTEQAEKLLLDLPFIK